MTILFQDDFESGFSAWTGTTGSPTVQSTITHHGNYAASSTSTSLQCKWYKNISAYTEIYIRFYFYIPTFNNNNDNRILQIWNTAYTNQIIWGWSKWGGATSFRISSGAGHEDYKMASIATNTWICAEVYVKTGVANGIVTYWMNGVQIDTQTNIPISDFNVLSFGNMGYDPTDLFYIDCVVLSDSYVGPQEKTHFLNVKYG